MPRFSSAQSYVATFVNLKAITDYTDRATITKQNLKQRRLFGMKIYLKKLIQQ